MTKIELPKQNIINITDFLNYIKFCESCLWRPHYKDNITKKLEDIRCELDQPIPVKTICRGILHYSTCMSLCENCCKKISLGNLEKL